jgi:hypothetical protein
MISSQNWFSISRFSRATLAAGWDYGDKLSGDEEVDFAGDEFELRMATDVDDEDFVALQTEIEMEESDSDESTKMLP